MLDCLSGRIIGVCGEKDSGKTRVVEGLMSYFKRREFAVGTVKHVHDRIALQPESKDSMRHLGAGADAVVTLSEGITEILLRRGHELDEAVGFLALCDFVVIEGFKHSDVPKIVVNPGEALLRELVNVVALVADDPDLLPGGAGRAGGPGTEHDTGALHKGGRPEPLRGGVPVFRFKDTNELGEYLFAAGVLKQAGLATHLVVNGKAVPMNDFVRHALAGVVRGFLSSLRDVEEPTSVQLVIKYQP